MMQIYKCVCGDGGTGVEGGGQKGEGGGHIYNFFVGGGGGPHIQCFCFILASSAFGLKYLIITLHRPIKAKSRHQDPQLFLVP